MADAGTYIEITAVAPAAALHLRATRPRFTIDHLVNQPARWGSTTISVLPGTHQLEVWLPWSRGGRLGVASMEVPVTPGWVTQVIWRPPVVRGAGTLVLSGNRPALVDTRQPAGWYPDPTGRRELRWWDGTEWTAHAQQDGTTIHDVL